MNIQVIRPEDVKAVYRFWLKDYKVDGRDSVERITNFVEKNPGISMLAIEGDNVVGTCLGSYDGRKGYIYKIVISKEFYGTGLGRKIVVKTLDNIRSAGGLDVRVQCAPELVGFYEKCGFKVKEGVIHMQWKGY